MKCDNFFTIFTVPFYALVGLFCTFFLYRWVTVGFFFILSFEPSHTCNKPRVYNHRIREQQFLASQYLFKAAWCRSVFNIKTRTAGLDLTDHTHSNVNQWLFWCVKWFMMPRTLKHIKILYFYTVGMCSYLYNILILS